MDAEALRARLSTLAVRGLFALPAPFIRAIGRPRRDVDVTLHPEAWLLARLSVLDPETPVERLPPKQGRERYSRSIALLSVPPDVPVTAEDRRLPGPTGELPARLYVPRGASTPGPLLIYFHGGGCVIGSLDDYDGTCRLLAHHAGLRVLSVDYRLAPEHPFPAAVDDAFAAFAHVAANADELGVDPEAIAVGGDSAGGNLATVTALLARDAGGAQPAFQLLIYPFCDLSATRRPSRHTFAEGYVLTDSLMNWFRDQYVPDPGQREDPRCSPLLADDLSGLPPAYVVTAAADPLRDEGEEYAQRLRESGVPVAQHRQPLLHTFVSTTVARSSHEALALAAGALRQGLADATTRAAAAAS